MNNLKNFNIVFTKILFSDKISQELIDKLSQFEKKLLKDFIRYKSWNHKNFFKLDEKFFTNSIKYHKPPDNTKKLNFILKEIFIFLKSIFKIKIFKNIHQYLIHKYQCLNSSEKFEYAFYGYYFGGVSYKHNIKIKNFFYKEEAFKNYSEEKIQNYINMLKNSDKFNNNARFFLENLFINKKKEYFYNQSKELCLNWNNKIDEKNKNGFLQKIKKSNYDQLENNIFWNINECKQASKEFLHILTI